MSFSMNFGSNFGMQGLTGLSAPNYVSNTANTTPTTTTTTDTTTSAGTTSGSNTFNFAYVDPAKLTEAFKKYSFLPPSSPSTTTTTTSTTNTTSTNTTAPSTGGNVNNPVIPKAYGSNNGFVVLGNSYSNPDDAKPDNTNLKYLIFGGLGLGLAYVIYKRGEK